MTLEEFFEEIYNREYYTTYIVQLAYKYEDESEYTISNEILEYSGEMVWCDVIIYDKHHHDIGAKRNPSPLPHKNKICETCGFANDNYKMGEDGLICCNPEKDWVGSTVLPTYTCDGWLFDDNYYYFRENE